MNIADEVQLRSRLGAELDLLDPGPLPLDAVVKQGRAVMIRKRALAAIAVVIVAAAAVAVPKLVHIASQPASPPHYHVTVNPPGKGASKHLIATGTVNKLRWVATGMVKGGEVLTCLRINESSGQGCNGTAPGPTFPKDPAEIDGVEGSGPVFVTLTVRADVRYLLLSLTNGQTLTLRPIAIFGPAHPGIAAIMVPSNEAITEIQAFSATAELGYTVPFTAPTDIETVRWLKPSEPALPQGARYTIASGRLHGEPWAERLYVGPWGFCFTSTWESYANGVSYLCAPISVDQPGREVRPAGTQFVNSQVGFSVIVGPRQLSYVVVRPGRGEPFLVRAHRVGAASFVVLVSTGNSTSSWIGYSATSQRLGSKS
jgi:hypothetical protein